MFDTKIIRKLHKVEMHRLLYRYKYRIQGKEPKKLVCIINGLTGTGKTTFALDYFSDKKYFYFSFLGLNEEMAEILFAERISEYAKEKVNGWVDCFIKLAESYSVLILDDLTSISSYKRFHSAFYENTFPFKRSRPLTVLITHPTDNIDGLFDDYSHMNMTYFNMPEVKDIFTKLSKMDQLGLCAVSGGIPDILSEYDIESSFEDNLRKMLKPSSAFINYMQKLLSNYFRKPDNYNYILSAITCGHHSISEIGKYTGFAYNKCDNYLTSLIGCGIVKPKTVSSKSGAEKTSYILTNNYYRIWYRYVYKAHSDIQLSTISVTNDIIHAIIDREIHKFHVQKAHEYVEKRISSHGIKRSFISNQPYKVKSGNFEFTFDGITRNEKIAVLIKVLEDPEDNGGRETLEKIRKAVSLANIYYNSHVYIFAKRRFSDHTKKQASYDEVLSLVGVEQLR